MLSGDGPEKLRKLIEAVAGVGGRSFMRGLTKSLAAETTTRIKSCFSESRDPYGEKWKPLKYRNGMPLLDTGRLRNAFQDRSTPGQVRLFNPTVYANLHNYGGRLNSRAVMGRTLYFAKGGGFAGRRQRIWSQATARPHAIGPVIIPARPFIPDERRGIPAQWAKRFRQVAAQSVAMQLAKAR
jgi:phage gpG-like protein